MNEKKPERIKYYLILFTVYFALAGLLYWVGAEQMEATKVQTSTVTPLGSNGGLAGDNVLEQPFEVPTDTLDQVLLFVGTFGRTNNSSFTLQILDGDAVLWEHTYSADWLKDLQMNSFVLDKPLESVKGKKLLFRIMTKGVPEGESVTFYYGNTVSASKVQVAVRIDEPLTINGQTVNGMLCLSLIGRDLMAVRQFYWPVVLILGVLLSFLYFYSFRLYYREGKGIYAKVLGLRRYSFLLKQLVSRDFKTKYKRSVLGIFWSFLNPLLTMSVQYLIFSTLFKSSIPNFAVYLMTGGLIFNFFSEAVGLGLGSIVSNASLITKVYVPKYIYPVSKVLSSSVNVLISMIPLLGVILISGVQIHKAFILFPLALLYTIIFSTGMSLLLCSAMVFFRDTQFLWGIVSMLWMYMTPIFYPETIIPTQFLKLYHMNPLYQYIYFLREITINGVAPGPKTFLYCTATAAAALLAGLWVFRKTQDRFVFYL